MDACMHDYAKEYRKHGEIKFHNVGAQRVTTSFGKDYGFTSICNKVLKKFPTLSTPSKRHWFARLLLVQ